MDQLFQDPDLIHFGDRSRTDDPRKKFRITSDDILAKTVKGKGFPFAENQAAFHNAALNEEQFASGRKAVEAMLEEAGN